MWKKREEMPTVINGSKVIILKSVMEKKNGMKTIITQNN